MTHGPYHSQREAEFARLLASPRRIAPELEWHHVGNRHASVEKDHAVYSLSQAHVDLQDSASVPPRDRAQVSPAANLRAHLRDHAHSFVSQTGSVQSRKETQASPKLEAKPSRRFRDIYYDLNDQLSKMGVWVRRRETLDGTKSLPGPGFSTVTWEAKIKLAGDYTRSQMVEIVGCVEVRKLLQEHMPGTGLFDLDVMADLETLRQSWIVCRTPTADDQNPAACVDSQMCFDLDTVTASNYGSSAGEPFLHEVGELELLGESFAEEMRRSMHPSEQRLPKDWSCSWSVSSKVIRAGSLPLRCKAS